MFDEKVEKSILVGNGININFGGKAYSNQFILKRIIFNARAGKYGPLVNDIVSGEMIAIIFENFVSIANDIREGKYDAYISGEDVDILEDFKNRYNWRLAHYYEVGLEDWFFILHIYCLLYKELTENQKVLKQGFARMMLDSIYNDGDIQKLYMKMGRPVKKWLLEFDNVFTLNYDNNIEELTHKQVFHLHGDYRTLTHSLDPATLFGYIRKQKGERIEIPKGFKHCFCNALLDFAGDHKYKIALAFEKGEEGFLDLARRCVPEDALPGSISELLDAQSQHPELKFGVQYHFKEFRTLRGELHIIGMSPNNDSHIFKQIDESSIQKVVFYYYSDSEISNLGQKYVPIGEEYPTKFDRLLCGGIWCIVQLDYEFVEEERSNPIRIRSLTPIQMPHIDIDELKQGRKAFSKEEWMDVLLRSIGMEPDSLKEREKWLLIARMLPLVENNFNLCELGPRSTGKSHLYKEISPNSILVSGGQTTVANLFYNMSSKTVGLVGLWDCVAFDEVVGIKFKDKDGIQIMKDYMNSGSFSRGKEEKNASASMVFVGNINQSVDVLLRTSSLFEPFPPEMGTDTAFLDRIHCYIPGWEVPKLRPDHFTDDYGFITDYLAEFMRELRKEQHGDALDKYFRLGSNLNQRDTVAVRKMVDGFIKLLYSDGVFTKAEVEEVLQFALELRRRVKEQLKKLGGMEFYDVNFSYIDNETFEEHYVSVPEQGGGKLIPEGMCKPGQVYTVSRGKSGMIGVFRLESQMLPGNGKFERTGLGSDREAREASNTAFSYLKANGGRISGVISTVTKDYVVNYQDLQGIGMTGKLALPTLIAICSVALGKPTVGSLAVMGEMSISGTLIKVDELANALQVCLDSGAKKILLPITSASDLGAVPSDLIGCFNLIFYQSAEDAVYKALGVE